MVKTTFFATPGQLKSYPVSVHLANYIDVQTRAIPGRVAGQYVGVREVADEIWLVSFMNYDLGFFDKDENRVEQMGRNRFAPKVLPMSSE